MKDWTPQLKYILDNHPDNDRHTFAPFIPRICADLGVTHSTLYRWVNGKTKPRKKHQHIIIKVLEKYLCDMRERKEVLLGKK